MSTQSNNTTPTTYLWLTWVKLNFCKLIPIHQPVTTLVYKHLSQHTINESKAFIQGSLRMSLGHWMFLKIWGTPLIEGLNKGNKLFCTRAGFFHRLALKGLGGLSKPYNDTRQIFLLTAIMGIKFVKNEDLWVAPLTHFVCMGSMQWWSSFWLQIYNGEVDPSYVGASLGCKHSSST